MAATEQFRRKVREKMADQGISQGQLAELVGTSRPHINDILQGRKSPTLRTCEKISSSLGLELAELFENTPTTS